jgi:hypothetical protein
MDIKDIISRVNKLDNKEKIHVLNILKTNNIDFTKNRNGYFFNLSSVDQEIILKISKCLKLIETNMDLIRKIDKRREELLDYYKKIIQERVDDKIKKMKEEYNKKLLLYKMDTNIVMDIKNISNKKRNDKITQDPDEMIKEYNKTLYKYEKNSVFANILLKIKAYNSSHKGVDKKNKDRSDNYEDMDDIKFSDYNMMGDEYIEDDIIEDDIIEDDINEDDPIDDENVDDISNTDDEYETHCSDNESYLDDIDNEMEDEDDDKTKKEKIEVEMNINYYKNLLSKKGYAFDDSKKCILYYQEYIK